jgi:hypothetical protein
VATLTQPGLFRNTLVEEGGSVLPGFFWRKRHDYWSTIQNALRVPFASITNTAIILNALICDVHVYRRMPL